MSALNRPCFHGDNPTGDSPKSGPPTHHRHRPVVEALDESVSVEEAIFPLLAACDINAG